MKSSCSAPRPVKARNNRRRKRKPESSPDVSQSQPALAMEGSVDQLDDVCIQSEPVPDVVEVLTPAVAVSLDIRPGDFILQKGCATCCAKLAFSTTCATGCVWQASNIDSSPVDPGFFVFCTKTLDKERIRVKSKKVNGKITLVDTPGFATVSSVSWPRPFYANFIFK